MRRLAAAPRSDGAPAIRVVDVGTGSGAIAVTLAVLLRRRAALESVDLAATDVSGDALDLARENAVAHAVADAITFRLADLLAPDGEPPGLPYDLVLANLPYVRHGALAGLPIAATFEPALALDGGADGLEVVARLLRQLPAALAADGLTLLEIGFDQGDTIVDCCREVLPGWSCVVELDLAGLPRVARIRRG
jgi:release factor glutamine methyltransferase